MDPDRFDQLSKTVFHAGTRRQLLGRLTTVPVLGALTALLGPEETVAEHPANRLLQHKEQRRHKARQERRKTAVSSRTRTEQQQQRWWWQRWWRRGSPGALGGGTCVRLDQVCSVLPFATPCCAPMQCRATATVLVATCQYPGFNTACTSTSECQQDLGFPDVECVHIGLPVSPRTDADPRRAVAPTSALAAAPAVSRCRETSAAVRRAGLRAIWGVRLP